MAGFLPSSCLYRISEERERERAGVDNKDINALLGRSPRAAAAVVYGQQVTAEGEPAWVLPALLDKTGARRQELKN